ncbi:MAG: DedA family protein [Geminicoccaceae bacterium]
MTRLLALTLACFLALAATAHAESRIETAIHDVEPVLQKWGYAAVAGAATLDFLGVPVPAVTILAAATLGAARGDLSLPLVFALAMLGMIAGSQLGYGLGHWGGRALLRRVPWAASHAELVEHHHARFGLWLQLIAPFIDGVRQLNGFVAGMLGMPWHRFAAANAVAAPLWAGAWIAATMLVEDHAAAALALVQAGRPWLLAAAALTVLALIALAYLRHGSRAGPGSP